MRRLNFCCLLISLLAIVFLGCSGSGMPTVPDDLSHPQLDMNAVNNGRQLWGTWELYYDGEDLSVVNTTERYASLTHFDVKKFLKPPICFDCLQIANVVDDPANKVLSVDVTIKNPFQIEGADPRGIFMSKVPAVYLQNAEDYTDLWNDYNDDINGFKLFGKENADGVFGAGATSTETFEIKYNFVPFFLSTAIDAIYPATALREPYKIENQTIEGALDINGNVSRLLSLEVHDRNDDQGVVSVVCEELGIDTVLTQDNDDIWLYTGFVNNNAMAEPGDYTATITAFDSVTSWLLYDYMTIAVTSDVGTWVETPYTLANSGCPRDIAIGFDFFTAESSMYYSDGALCDNLSKVDLEFTSPALFYELINIDPLVPDFSPFPVSRLDVAASGGVAFFVDSDTTYTDPYYTGPYSSLLISLVPDMMGDIGYLNPGDGDAGRIPPPHPDYKGIDVCDDLQGNLYGVWNDANSTLNPLVYGMIFDYTRHDVLMGGVLPDEISGETVNRVSREIGNIKAIQVGEFLFESGDMYFLENDGEYSYIEVMTFTIDFNLKTTSWASKDNIALGQIDAVDLDLLLFNPSYLPNTESNTIAVLVNGPTGPYVKMFETAEFEEVETIGTPEEPLMAGNGVALEVNSDFGDIWLSNDAEDILKLQWTL